MTAAKQLQTLLNLSAPPIGVAFLAAPPAGVRHSQAAGPSSCAYWQRAAEGESFYTEAADHFGCPIGGYTHGVSLPEAQTQELQGVVTTMIELGYLRGEEVAQIPRREEPFSIAYYAPAEQLPEADLVLVHGKPKQIMLLQEATQAAGVGGQAGLMGRPTCAALPMALRDGCGVASLGCIGNRVYARLGDDELYYILPGRHLTAVVEKLATLVHANRELEKYHRARC